MTAEEKTQYLATLIALIHVDGKIQKSEERLLNTVAREIGAGFHFLEQAEKAVQSGDVSSQPPPPRSSDALRLLEDMLFISNADGSFSAEEKKEVLAAVKDLGLSSDQVDRLKAECRQRLKDLKD